MGRVLLDTHLLLWWLNDDPRLPNFLIKKLQSDSAQCPDQPSLALEDGDYDQSRDVNRRPNRPGATSPSRGFSVNRDHALEAYVSCVRVIN